MAKVQRSEFIIVWLHRTNSDWILHIGNLANGTLAGDLFSLGLREEIVALLLEHGSCFDCGIRICGLQNPCICGSDSKLGEYLRIQLAQSAGDPNFNRLLDKEDGIVRSEKRARLLAAVPQTLTEREVSLLLDWQSGMCFYCGNDFEVRSIGLEFHRDHFHPLVYGGATTIENTVLACPLCNRKKGKKDGPTFLRTAARTRAPAIKDHYLKMRNRFRTQLKKYLLDVDKPEI